MNARNAILTLFFQKKRSFHRFYVCLLSIFVKPHHYKLFLIPLALEFRPLCSLQFPTWNIKKELERSFIILPPPLSSQQESVLQRLVVSLEFFLSSCLRRYRIVLRALVLTFLRQITLTTCLYQTLNNLVTWDSECFLKTKRTQQKVAGLTFPMANFIWLSGITVYVREAIGNFDWTKFS